MLRRRKNTKNISDLFVTSNEDTSDGIVIANVIEPLRKRVRRLITEKHSDIK